MSDCKKCGNPDMPHNPCMCDDIGEMDTLVGMCAKCYKYACSCVRVEDTPEDIVATNLDIDRFTLARLIDARGLDWVLAELSAHAGEKVANACRARGNPNLSAWGETRRHLQAALLVVLKNLTVAR